jgi:NADPH:quinone reductase-like Zn-dependent oxidoreductase
LVDVSVGDPGPGEIRIRHKAVGLNFIDVYHRTVCTRCPCPMVWAWKVQAWWKPWARASRI